MWGKANEVQQEHSASMEAYRRYEDVRRLLKPLCIAVTLVLAFLAYPAVYKVEAAVHPSQNLANAQIRPQVALKAQIRQYVIQQPNSMGLTLPWPPVWFPTSPSGYRISSARKRAVGFPRGCGRFTQRLGQTSRARRPLT
jgi:hypothetical protein